MQEEYRNIYKTARHAAGYTQEAAAELLGVSVESLRAYETDQRVPPDGTVVRMVECYNTQHLAYQHLRENNALMGRVVPDLEERSVLEVAVRIYNRMKSFDNRGQLDRLLSIAEDNIVDDAERPEFLAITKEVQEIIKGGLELRVFCAKPKEEPKWQNI